MQSFIFVILALACSAQASYPAAEPIVTYHEEARPISYAAPITYIQEEPSYSHATVSAYTYSIHHPQPAVRTVVVPHVIEQPAPVITKVIERPAPVITKVIEQPHVEYGLPAVAATRFIEPIAAPHTTYGTPNW